MVYIEPVGTGASGRLPDPRQYDLATCTHFLHAVIEHLAPETVLLGHSHGGSVAQRYALDHPEHVTALFLYETSPMTGEGFWSVAVASMERFAQRHVGEHTEVATYVDGLTAVECGINGNNCAPVSGIRQPVPGQARDLRLLGGERPWSGDRALGHRLPVAATRGSYVL